MTVYVPQVVPTDVYEKEVSPDDTQRETITMTHMTFHLLPSMEELDIRANLPMY